MNREEEEEEVDDGDNADDRQADLIINEHTGTRYRDKRQI